MNFSDQQTSTVQQEMAVFSPGTIEETPAVREAPLSSNPLAMLEARLTGMASTIVALNSKVSVLRKIIADRDARIESVEQTNADLEQQVASLSISHSQMVDGVASLLTRFPDNKTIGETDGEDLISVDTSLLQETVGSA